MGAVTDALLNAREQFLLKGLSPPVEVRLAEEDGETWLREVGPLCVYQSAENEYGFKFAGMKITW